MNDDTWLKHCWGNDWQLMKQAIHEVNPMPHFHNEHERKVEISYLVVERFKELKHSTVRQTVQ